MEEYRAHSWAPFLVGVIITTCLFGVIVLKLYVDNQELNDQVESLQSQIERYKSQEQEDIGP